MVTAGTKPSSITAATLVAVVPCAAAAILYPQERGKVLGVQLGLVRPGLLLPRVTRKHPTPLTRAILEPLEAAAPAITAMAVVALAAATAMAIPTAAALAAVVAPILMTLAALAALAPLATTAFALILAAVCPTLAIAALLRRVSLTASPICHTGATTGVAKTEPPTGVPATIAASDSCTHGRVTAVRYLTAQGRVGRARQSALAPLCAAS